MRLGSRRAQHILVGELIAVLVIIVLDDVMDVGAVVNLPVQATALAGLFLVLALLSASGRSGERIAVGFGGLVVLGVAVQRWPMFTAMRSAATIAYGKAYKGQAAIQAPGPPVVDPAPPPNARLGGTL